MSMAPANRASIAAGPALNVFHSIFTPGPSAFSKNPLAFPTMACECVMLGKAPTRIVAAPCAQPDTASAIHRTKPDKNFLLTLVSPDHHAQNAARFFFLG